VITQEPIPVTITEPLKVITADTDVNQWLVEVTPFPSTSYAKILDGPFILKTASIIVGSSVWLHITSLGTTCEWINRSIAITNVPIDAPPLNLLFPVAANQTLCAADSGLSGGGSVVVVGYVPYQ